MTVWIVSDAFGVRGVFPTRAAADAYVAQHSDDGRMYFVERWIVAD